MIRQLERAQFFSFNFDNNNKLAAYVIGPAPPSPTTTKKNDEWMDEAPAIGLIVVGSVLAF